MTLDVIAAARRRTRRRLLIAAAVATGLCGAAVYPAGLYVNAHQHPAPHTTATRSESPTTSTREIPADGPATDAIAPAPGSGSAPGEVVQFGALTWASVAGVSLPCSATDGPRDTGRGRARGFAHTRAGAVLAAVHLLVRTTAQAGPDVFAPTLAEQVVGPDAAAMRLVVQTNYAQLAHSPGPHTLPAVLVGFRLDDFTGPAAALHILTAVVDQAGATRFAATAVQLRWGGTDWALLAPPGGTWDSTVKPVTAADASGFATFTTGR